MDRNQIVSERNLPHAARSGAKYRYLVVANPGLEILAFRFAPAGLHRAGANRVISSAKIGGRRMASMLLRPRVVEFLDVIMSDLEVALRLEEIDISEASPFVGNSIRDLHIRGRTGTLVIGFQRKDGPVQLNPPADAVLEPGDVLIVLGNEEQVENLRAISKTNSQEVA